MAITNKALDIRCKKEAIRDEMAEIHKGMLESIKTIPPFVMKLMAEETVAWRELAESVLSMPPQGPAASLDGLGEALELRKISANKLRGELPLISK